MKKINKYLLCLCLSIMFCLSSLDNVYAAGISVKASKSTVSVGEKVTFTVSISGGAGYISVSGAASGKVWLDNSSQSYTVTAKNIGTLTLNVSGVIADYSTEKDVNVSGSKSVNVITKNTSHVPTLPPTTPQPSVVDNRSKDNSLSTLKVSEGKLSPTFRPSTTKYTVNVSATIAKIKIQATANDKKAHVSGTGEKSLNVGKNIFVIKCIAENGNIRNYTIEINVDEKPLVYTDFNGQKLGVVRNLKGIGIPDGFKQIESDLENQKITAWKNDKLGLTISFLIDENEKKNFYVVGNNKVLYPFMEMNIDERQFIVIPVEEQNREGFIYQKVKIKEIELEGWIYEDKAMKDYVQVYLMNDKGIKQIYDYEITENQLQKYTEPTSDKGNLDVYMITSIVLGFMCAISISYIIYRKSKKKA